MALAGPSKYQVEGEDEVVYFDWLPTNEAVEDFWEWADKESTGYVRVIEFQLWPPTVLGGLTLGTNVFGSPTFYNYPTDIRGSCGYVIYARVGYDPSWSDPAGDDDWSEEQHREELAGYHP